MPWPGIGRSIWAEVAFRVGDTTYRVGGSRDRLADGGDPAAPTGRVRVEQVGTVVAELACRAGTVAFPADGALFDAMSAAGRVWDPGARGWRRPK